MDCFGGWGGGGGWEWEKGGEEVDCKGSEGEGFEKKADWVGREGECE